MPPMGPLPSTLSARSLVLSQVCMRSRRKPGGPGLLITWGAGGILSFWENVSLGALKDSLRTQILLSFQISTTHILLVQGSRSYLPLPSQNVPSSGKILIEVPLAGAPVQASVTTGR